MSFIYVLFSTGLVSREVFPKKTRTDEQNLFPIVQGGLDPVKRKDCAEELIKRDTPGFAIGGLSGGEAKDDFWKMVHVSTDELPDDKPRYLMGVGFAVDLVVCSALGKKIRPTQKCLLNSPCI